MFCAKNRCKKHQNIGEVRPFWKSAILQRLYTLQNGQFASKIQMAKNVWKTIMQARYSCSVQKTDWKKSKYCRNKTILKIGHLAKVIDFAKWSLWVKNSNGQKRAKNDSTNTLELFCAKTASKNTKYSRNETSLKIGHLAKTIDFAKWSVWVKTSNGQKRLKNDSTSMLEMLCAKNRCKKHQILEKWDHFENRPSCKGYRLSKMVSLGQNFKWPKTCEKRFYKQVRIVLLEKTAAKNTKYSSNETILKIGHLAKAIDFAKWSVWVKNSNGQKPAKNVFTSTWELFWGKNPWKKHKIFEKWDHFENRPLWKGYRLWKMVRLAKKLKWQKTCEKRFYKHVRVVLCKKPIEKTANVEEKTPFWKSAILQRL